MRAFRKILLTTGAVCSAVMAVPAAAQERQPQTTQARAQGDTLQTILASVYNGNPRLLAERARLREVDENYIQARAQGRPTIGLGGEFSLQTIRTPETEASFFNPSGGGGWNSGTPYTAQLSVVQPIYQGGRVKALRRQAQAGIMAARAGLENAENSIFLSAANAYVDILRDEEAASIRRNNVRVLTRQLTAANERFNVGEGTRTDIAQSESRLAASEAGLAQADAQLDISRALFVRIVGRLPNQLAPAPTFVLPESLEQAISLARNNNPQLLAANYNELAGSAAIDVAKSAGRPTLSLQGTLAGSRQTILGVEETDQATIGAQLNIPIFSGGGNASRVRQAQHVKTRLRFETRDTERAVDQTVAQVWAQMTAARLIVATSKRQVEAADIAFEGVSLEQQVGTRTQLDVLDAEQETLNAKLNLINAERDLSASVFQLLSTIGVLDADGIDLPINAHDPDVYLSNVVYDGFKEAGDRLIPEVIQKIGPQLPNLVADPARVVGSGVGLLDLDEGAAKIGRGLLDIADAVKEGVDTLTFQEPHYDPRINEADIEIVINPDPEYIGSVSVEDSALPIQADQVSDSEIKEDETPGEPLVFPEISIPPSDR
jgi:outer membrane protein